MLSRRQLLATGPVAVGALLVGAGDSEGARRRVRTTSHRLPWPVCRPLRIAHLTDVHIGWGAPKALAMEAVAQIGLARPDLTVLTGDYVNHVFHLNDLREILRRLPRPCVATLGNHDHQLGAAKVRAVLEGEGIQVLSNEARTLELGGSRITVVGVDDAVTRHHDVPGAMAKVPATERAIVLSHAPGLADEISRQGCGRHLVLAGHTHAGQVYVPWVSPAIARLKGTRYLAGWYSIGKSRLYVNAGIGDATVRVRAGARAQPEVAVLELYPERSIPCELERDAP